MLHDDLPIAIMVQCPAERAQYSAQKMLIRDGWMVNQGVDAEKAGGHGRVVALWSGREGGTAHTVRSAYRAGLTLDNVWGAWIAEGSLGALPPLSPRRPVNDEPDCDDAP
jgi:hypothetical protein